MFEGVLVPTLAEIAGRGIVTLKDVLLARRTIFPNGVESQEEAESLFHLNQVCKIVDSSWNLFFVEVLTDYIVHHSEPRGYVTIENADWLIASISRDGSVHSASELELLVNVLDKARWAPLSLVTFALEQVKYGILKDKGPLRDGLKLELGQIGTAEIEVLRRILYAFGGDENIVISHSEAEVLFDINDATSKTDNDLEWSELFVKAIASFIMGASGYKAPNRKETLAAEQWLHSSETVSDFMGKMVSGGFKAIFNAYQKKSFEELSLDKLDQQYKEMLLNEPVTQGKAEWLIERIAHNGEINENERALLLFIKEESQNIDPSLQTLIEQAA